MSYSILLNSNSAHTKSCMGRLLAIEFGRDKCGAQSAIRDSLLHNNIVLLGMPDASIVTSTICTGNTLLNEYTTV